MKITTLSSKAFDNSSIIKTFKSFSYFDIKKLSLFNTDFFQRNLLKLFANLKPLKRFKSFSCFILFKIATLKFFILNHWNVRVKWKLGFLKAFLLFQSFLLFILTRIATLKYFIFESLKTWKTTSMKYQAQPLIVSVMNRTRVFLPEEFEEGNFQS